MGIIKTSASAIGKLLIVVALGGAFLVGAVSAVYMSLRGEEVKVPEVVGKDFYASENEIAALGLKMKKRATRYSEEKPNTVLEQLPKPGETVKTGQTILVVTSEVNPEGSEAPATIKKGEPDDEDQSTDVTPEKSVKTNKNTNTKKPAQTTRDVIANKSNANAANSNSSGNSNKSESKSEAGNKNGSTAPAVKSEPGNSNKSESAKPTPAKTPAVTGGDTRTRKVP